MFMIPPIHATFPHHTTGGKPSWSLQKRFWIGRGRWATRRQALAVKPLPALLVAVVIACLCLAGNGAHADASCHNGKSFRAWLVDLRKEAASAKISDATLATLDGVAPDPKVLKQDRGQPTLSLSFLDFVSRVVSADRLSRGRALLKKHAATFARIEREFDVPGPVIVAFWGLETDYGAFTGDYSSLRSLATLAYDCRRPEHFRAELIDALRLVESGELQLSEMKGAWAGELGQVQFTPSNYLKYAVDYDGDKRRDLVGSIPDALASTANYLKAIGWRGGEPWLEEVRVAEGMPWHEAGRGNFRPRSFWAAAGVTPAGGGALPADKMPAALLLPMGRLGPAFLSYQNFGIFWDWNQSSNYSLAAAYIATRLAGAPALRPGAAPPILSSDDMREVQQRLNALGYDAGTPDGRLGEITRSGVKQGQAKFGLPADGYPTKELLTLLRKGK